MAIEIGEKVSGKVTGITNFGAFVDLGESKTGLVHISEVSDSYVKDIHDVLSVGDTVTVKVMSEKEGKIGLSIRRAVDKPASEHSQEHAHTSSSRPHSSGPRSNGPHAGGNHGSFNRNNHSNGHEGGKEDFDSLLTGFLKESEDRLTSLKRNTEGKRGGRGGRRS